ncbi:hypothetical protein BRC81_08225 [Halobacteriales archaeon QS_1_68_20]|nr:MAG: hypothetical protein BRC81_08225 [Halobacteriales archaeon QS_1_68_20]
MSGVQRPPPARRGLASAIDPKRGAIFGAGAWAFGVVVTAVLSWIEFRQTASALESMGGSGEAEQLSEFLPSAFDTVGFMFYNAHFVNVGFDFGVVGMWMNFVRGNVEVTGLGVGQTAPGGMGWLTELERMIDGLVGTVPTVVWLLVPVVTLAWGGYMVTARNDVTDPVAGAKTGTSVVVGYAALAVAGTFLFTWRLSPSGEVVELTIRPQLTVAAALMGVVYPVVFGGVGGWVAVRRNDDEARPDPAERQRRQPPGPQERPGNSRSPPANPPRPPAEDPRPPANGQRQPTDDPRPPADRQGPPAGTGRPPGNRRDEARRPPDRDHDASRRPPAQRDPERRDAGSTSRRPARRPRDGERPADAPGDDRPRPGRERPSPGRDRTPEPGQRPPESGDRPAGDDDPQDGSADRSSELGGEGGDDDGRSGERGV